MNAHPTPYPDINAILLELLAHVQKILGPQFVGMYLYGSLSMGDFDPEASDIDFLVVTAEHVSAETFSALQALHTRLVAMDSKWASELEGSYIPQPALRRYEPNGVPYPTLNEGKFYLAPHESDWIIQRYIIRERGVVVQGPEPKALIDPVSPGDLRHAVIDVMHEWWEKKLNDPDYWQHRRYQSYAVLSMCRVLYTLQHGTIVSKPVATRWVQETLDGRWSALIERAWLGRRNPHSQAEAEDVKETLEFIRYTVERCEEKGD